MRRLVMVLTVLLVGLVLIFALGVTTQKAQALPEYATQTGEPCASCHISPSGGGPRGPRGQAWVGSGKPGAVPDLVQSLELLGVKLESNPQDYLAGDAPPAPAQPLQVEPGQIENLHDLLKNYDGN